jgi:hypothetical protein
MAKTRTGARKALDILRVACRLSHIPGFRNGVNEILGANRAADFFSVWDPFCSTLDLIMSEDDFFNRMDATGPSVIGGEDIVPL